jgi:hypothetical protein
MSPVGAFKILHPDAEPLLASPSTSQHHPKNRW